jgi:hypothetical protein
MDSLDETTSWCELVRFFWRHRGVVIMLPSTDDTSDLGDFVRDTTMTSFVVPDVVDANLFIPLGPALKEEIVVETDHMMLVELLQLVRNYTSTTFSSRRITGLSYMNYFFRIFHVLGTDDEVDGGWHEY